MNNGLLELSVTSASLRAIQKWSLTSTDELSEDLGLWPSTTSEIPWGPFTKQGWALSKGSVRAPAALETACGKLP